ncbi:serine-rich adhesin for platelets isoform X2 [Magallana gigas]|uniref:serine-rich adhesin for platelets isoform X2 n=1 Tax=Magallana gigas TaxID=29159 RepID=UPI0033428DE5
MKQQKLKVLIALTLTMLYFPSFLGNVQENTTLEVEYSPTVSLSKTQKTVEGQNLSITCSYSPGNPITTSLYWTKTNSVFRYNGQLLQIPNIGRKDSGTYVCHAENTYSSGKKGTANATIEIDVQYGPSLTYGQALKVSEGQSARMSTSVTSNPASNVSWSRDNLLVSTQQYVNGTTRYTIQKTQCTDTGPFQVVASNGVQSKQATKVFLYVYCSPRLTTCGSSVELLVDGDFNLKGQISILSYPQPNASLTLPNGALNTLITLRVNPTATNLFTITLTRSNLHSDDFGTYVLNVANQYGRIMIYVNITSSKSFSSTVVVVGSVLGGVLFLAICAFVFLSYKYLLVRKVPTRSFITLEKEKSKVDIHMNEPSTCDEKAAVEETQNISKSNQFKLIIFDIFKKKGRRKINYPTLETPYCVQINESPVTETNFTKTGKELYANTDEFAATTSDQNRGNTKSKQASDTESGNIGKKKAKHSTLETANWAKTNKSPFTENNFTKTKTGKELYANAEELAATACDQNRENTKSKIAGDTESGNSGKKKTKNSTLETPNWAKTNKSPFTETYFTKTKTGKELYANAEELAATACDQNRENTKSKIAGDTESGNSGKKKTKNSTLETPNWAKTNESPFTETSFPKTKTGKEIYANAEELAATACDQNRENTKSKIADDTESGNSGKKKTKNSTLETPNWAKTNESPFTETNFTKTKTGKELYANAEELAATACDQNRGNTKSKKEGETKSGYSEKTKSKPLVLPKPKKKLSKASKAFSYF